MSLDLSIIGFFIALSASILGVLIVLRRMALVSDALSHVALPGLALAITLGINPFFGAFAFLFLSVLAIYFIQKKFEFGTETLVGIMFTAALAVGVLATPEEHLYESLFGDISQLSSADSWIAAIGGIFILAATLYWWRHFLKTIISPELALGEQINIKKIDLFFMFLLALSVAIGIKAVGTLLMGALIIIPAATAKNLSRNLRQMILFSILIGVSTTMLGLWLASSLAWAPGPAIVLINVALFIVSLFL